MITKLAVHGYRSLRDIRLELDALNVVTGANGSGKSSLYRSLRLLADIAQGRIIRALALEGGLNSTLWAGPERLSRAMRQGDHPVQGTVRKDSVSLKFGFASDDYGYAIDLGLPIPGRTRFNHDPHIKAEALWVGQTLSPRNLLAERKGTHIRVRGLDGWQDLSLPLSPFDSMMTHASDPKDAAEILIVREQMRRWRFYDHFRSDRDAPARTPQIGTHTPVLASDGSDLAAAVQTLLEIGDEDAFAAAIDDAFPGASLAVNAHDGYFELIMHQKGLLRPLKAAELSDGTLRYILLVTALLSPRPAPFIVLNEPEMSLHPDLLPALGRLIAQASKRSQTLVVSHADALVDAIADTGPLHRIQLEKDFSETRLVEGNEADWDWLKR